MADYCGLFYRTNAVTRSDILGDFEEAVRRVDDRLPPGTFVQIGICEGHGAGMIAARTDDGTLWFVHVPLGSRKRRGTPDPIAVPQG